MAFDLNDLDAAMSSCQVDSGNSPALTEKSDAEKLIAELAKRNNSDENTAFMAIALICQKGGTAKKAQGNVYIIINGIKTDLSLIRQIMNELKLKFTLRQFARTYCNEIYKIASFFDIEGDLAKKIGRNYQNLSRDEKIWLANFQMDNPNCPEDIRNYLMEHFNSLFPGKNP